MEINLYKDIKPTWEILPFDEETEKIPTKSNSYSWNNNPLDRDIAYFFRGKEFGRGIYFLPKTGVIADTQREVYGRYKGLLIHLLIKDHIEDRKAKKAREQRRYERLKRRLES